MVELLELEVHHISIEGMDPVMLLLPQMQFLKMAQQWLLYPNILHKEFFQHQWVSKLRKWAMICSTSQKLNCSERNFQEHNRKLLVLEAAAAEWKLNPLQIRALRKHDKGEEIGDDDWEFYMHR